MSNPPSPMLLPQDGIAGYLLNEPAPITIGPRAGDLDGEARRKEEEEYQEARHGEYFPGQDEGSSERRECLSRWRSRSLTFVTARGGSVQGLDLGAWAEAAEFVYAAARQDELKRGEGGSSQHQPLELELKDFSCESVIFFDKNFVRDEELEVSPTLVIELLTLSCFVGCNSAKQTLAEVVKEGIDAENVASICQLADHLSLPSLLEECLEYIVKRLDDIKQHPFYSDMNRELQNRIIAMQNLVRSSVIGRGQRSGLFFSNADEFIAVFSDSIRDQKERLIEAKRRNDEVRNEGISRGTGAMSSVKYADEKLAKQAERIETLQAFLVEQKKIFAGQDAVPFDLSKK